MGTRPSGNERRIHSEMFDLKKISDSVQRHVSSVITECVRHHQKIFEVSEKVEKEFNVLMLLQVLSSVAMTCFQLFQLSMVSYYKS